MRIAQLTTDGRDLLRRYHETKPSFGRAPEALLEGFATDPSLEVHVISCTRQPLESPAKLAPNVFFHTLNVPRIGWLRTGYQGCIRAVRRKVRELQIDLVHGQGTERDCAISAMLSGLPNVVTLHGIMRAQADLLRARFGSFYWLAARIEAFTLPRTAGVLCNSAYTEELVRSLTRQTWRVANPIREAFFAPSAPPVSATGRPRLLNVGVISARKQQNELLGLAEELHRNGAEFEWRFIGALDPRAPYAREFQQRVQRAEAAGYARHLGVLDTTELIREFDEAAALVHFPTEEAFGLVVAEALARNLKLFAARVGGMVDIATGVEAAELIPMADFEKLGRSIVKWGRQGFTRPQQASGTIQERYHPAVIARRHREIYREVLQTDGA